MVPVVSEEFEVVYIYIFLLLFVFHYQMSIGKRSAFAKNWGGGGGFQPPPFSHVNWPLATL